MQGGSGQNPGLQVQFLLGPSDLISDDLPSCCSWDIFRLHYLEIVLLAGATVQSSQKSMLQTCG